MPQLNFERLRIPVAISIVLQGTILALAISLVLSVLIGIVYFFTSITEQNLPWFAAAILSVSVFIGSVIAARKSGNKGLHHGLSVGLLFLFCVWVISGIFISGQAALGLGLKMIIVLLSGAFGGIVGVGFQR